MAKEDTIHVNGQVTDVHPSGLFSVHLETGQTILARIAGRLRISHIRIVKGDSVMVEISPYDLTRGRIIHRYRHQAA